MSTTVQDVPNRPVPPGRRGGLAAERGSVRLAEALRRAPVFAGLAEQTLGWLTRSGEILTLRRGDVIARQGEPADGFYVVLEGVTTWTRRGGTRERHVVDLGPGECFAELILLLGEPYPTTGRASTLVRLFRIAPAQFWTLLRSCPTVARALSAVAVERARLHERAAAQLLSDASDVLHSSLEYEETMQGAASLMVDEGLADVCLVDLAEPEGGFRRVAVAGAPAGCHAQLRNLAGEEAPSGIPGATSEDGSAPEVTEAVPEDWLRQASWTAERNRVIRLLRATCVMVAPLVARGRSLGALWLVRTGTGSHFGPTEIDLAGELARRAALAVDNARFFDEKVRAVHLRDEVLGVVAHDLRNPVATVRMAADLLLDAEFLATAATREKHLRVIRRQADRMEHLIRDLLEVSRIAAGQVALRRRALPPSELLADAEEALRCAAKQRDIQLRFVAAPGLPDVWADAERVAQVFGNLGGNALKFTPAGGRVTVTAAGTPGGVLFRVADTGPGLPPHQLARIWDRFWQADAGDRRGAGLGLAIVKGIVEAHDGCVLVESVEGVGSSFGFTLPAARPGS